MDLLYSRKHNAVPKAMVVNQLQQVSLSLCKMFIFIFIHRCGNWSNIQQLLYTGTLFVRLITSTNIEQFSNCFLSQNLEKIYNNVITIDPTTPQMCRYTTLWNINVLKATIENKTSVTTRFRKLTTENNMFIVLLIV